MYARLYLIITIVLVACIANFTSYILHVGPTARLSKGQAWPSPARGRPWPDPEGQGSGPAHLLLDLTLVGSGPAPIWPSPQGWPGVHPGPPSYFALGTLQFCKLILTSKFIIFAIIFSLLYNCSKNKKYRQWWQCVHDHSTSSHVLQHPIHAHGATQQISASLRACTVRTHEEAAVRSDVVHLPVHDLWCLITE